LPQNFFFPHLLAQEKLHVRSLKKGMTSIFSMYSRFQDILHDFDVKYLDSYDVRIFLRTGTQCSNLLLIEIFGFLHEQRKPELKTVEEEDEVYDGEETIDYWFFVNEWFATDEGDKQIIRELIPTDKDGKPLKRALDGNFIQITTLFYNCIMNFSENMPFSTFRLWIFYTSMHALIQTQKFDTGPFIGQTDFLKKILKIF
jgi:hypothetical protein